MNNPRTKHLVFIKEIIENFIKKYDFNRYYFSIKGEVSVYSSGGRLKISCMHELDALTFGEVKNLEAGIYEEIRKYLETNNIKDILYIEDNSYQYKYKKIHIYFRDEVVIYS